MFLSDEIERIFDVLRASSELEHITFIKAYPYAIKPTKLDKRACTISSGKVEMDSMSIDGEDYLGVGYVELTFFSPFSFGTKDMIEDMRKIITASMSPLVRSVSISPQEKDEPTECVRIRAQLGFEYYMNNQEG